MSSRFKQYCYRCVAAIAILHNTLAAAPQDDFIAAAKRGNVKQAEKAIVAGGVEINAADAKGKTAVLYACENGSVDFLTWLASQNADFKSQDNEGNNCLHLTIRSRKAAQVIPLAIERGVDREAQNAKGMTPLVAAYDANQFKSFEALQVAGANLNAPHPKSASPLIVEVVKRERLQYANFLIEKGADTNARDAEGHNLLVICAQQSLHELVPALLQRGLSIESRDKNNKTITQMVHENLLKRVSPAREKMFSAIFDNGANPNSPSSTGRSLLMEQAESGRYNQVKVLIEKGADVNFRDKTGNTVLHTTALRNQLGVMRLVAEKFSDINLTGDSGNTAAHLAARSGATGILKLVKDRGANLELKNNAGETPLSIAIGRQDPATTRAILALGASLSDEGRETPLVLEVAKSGAVNGKTVELLGVLKKAGANMNAVNRFGNNALSYALSRNNFKMAESFLRAGAQSEAGDSRGNTLLHKLALASRYNKLKNQMLSDWLYLILSYQDANLQNSAGQTALHLAASGENNPDMEGASQFFERLVDLGADTSLRDAAGQSAFDAGKRVGWQTIAAANLPAQPIQQNIQQVFATPEADKYLRLTTADRDFYLAAQVGAEMRLARLSDALEVRAQKSFPSLQAVVAAGDGVVIAGTRPGEIDGAADAKCKEGKNLVVFVQFLDAGLNTRWEATWGKSGACQRTAAVALGYDMQGNTVVQAEFAGRRSLRRINASGAFAGEDVVRNDKLGEMVFLPDNTAAIAGAQNVIVDTETGKTNGRLSKSRGYRALAVSANATRYTAGDFQKLSGRRGVALSAEDAEGKVQWTRHFAGAKTMTIEMLAASDEHVCVTGRVNGALHGQMPAGTNDLYVACNNAQGTRIFTRVLPAANMQLVDMKVNRRGNVVLVLQSGDKKNPDLLLYRIDSAGRLYN